MLYVQLHVAVKVYLQLSTFSIILVICVQSKNKDVTCPYTCCEGICAGGIAVHVLNPGFRWRKVFRFIPQVVSPH
jgi:xanthine/uracil permease